VDFSQASLATLKRYKRMFGLRGVTTREDLVRAVTHHFESQAIHEESVTYFVHNANKR